MHPVFHITIHLDSTFKICGLPSIVLSDISDISTAPIGASFDNGGGTDGQHQGNFLQKLGFQADSAAPPNYDEETNNEDYFDEDCQEGLLKEVKKEIAGNEDSAGFIFYS